MTDFDENSMRGQVIKYLQEASDLSNIYFAYGSNMNRCQMMQRCPGAKPFALGRLLDYQFIINTRGVASVVPKMSK